MGIVLHLLGRALHRRYESAEALLRLVSTKPAGPCADVSMAVQEQAAMMDEPPEQPGGARSNVRGGVRQAHAV